MDRGVDNTRPGLLSCGLRNHPSGDIVTPLKERLASVQLTAVLRRLQVTGSQGGSVLGQLGNRPLAHIATNSSLIGMVPFRTKVEWTQVKRKGMF